MMFTGEEVGKSLNIEKVVEGQNGELYENVEHLLIGRPLDIATTVYVRLYRAVAHLDDVKEVHVIWNHYTETIRAFVAFKDEMATQELKSEQIRMHWNKVELVKQLVYNFERLARERANR